VTDKASTAPPGNFSTDYPISKALSTPAVRHLAKQKGVDINKVPGTGLRGRVTKGDILQFIESGHGTAS
jgi:2-oxoisovalerate dehydrogenase E2 component (dihydrolipoyl transacylase)